VWRSDGWGWRARIGLIVPHADICEEAELQAMSPDGVSIHATRVPFGAMGKGGTMAPVVGSDALRAYLKPPLLDDAAELMAFAPVHVIALCFTNTSFLGTVDDDRALVARLTQRTGSVRLTVTCLSALAALQALGAQRLAFVNPPWVDADLTKGGAAYFKGAGLEVVLAESAGVPNNPRDVQPGTLYEWTRTHVPSSADAVFIGGNGFRAVAAIEALEEDLGRPVLTANQVILWNCLRLAGANVRVSGYGRIFDSLPTSRT
jgi:maleate isomerase